MKIMADRIAHLGTEKAFKLADNLRECAALGIGVVKLNLGEPDFDTSPIICEEGIKQIADGATHYCAPAGLMTFRKAAAKYISETRNISVDWEKVIVTSGAKPPIGFAVMAYANPGDEVIYPSPGYPIYESWITYVGAKPVPLPLTDRNDFRFNADELEKLITPKTKLIFICSPSNPTGGVLTREDLESIADVIKRKCPNNVRVYSDEIYEHIVFDGVKHCSIASIEGMLEKTIIVSGHSKGFAMTGWRLGYAILPTIEEAEVFKNLNINTIACVAPFVQEAGRIAYENPLVALEVKKMVQAFEKRRNFAVPALNDIDGIRCAMPRGAFYLFPNIEGACKNLGILDAYSQLPERDQTSPSTLFQMFALYKHGVATMDRKSFGEIGAENEHYIRLSIATDLETIKEGIKRIKNASEDREGFKKFIAEGKHFY